MNEQLFYWYNSQDNKVDQSELNIEHPRQCMHCKNTGIQINLGCFRTPGRYDKFDGIALYSCQFCGSTTIHYLKNWSMRFDGTYQPNKSIPTIKEHLPDVSKHIQNEFPDFYNIYTQSVEAEDRELDQIAGMGYRKALEFLVTDYLLDYPVDGVEAEWLRNPKTTLAKKISKIPSQRMQNLAKAISFLGNDETHYSKQHPEHDINSIKAFIRALVSEIQNEIEYKKAEALINKPRP